MRAPLPGILLLATLTAPASFAAERSLPLDHLTLFGCRTEPVTYRGKKAIHLRVSLGNEAVDDSMLALIPNSDFQDGVIELDVAGSPVAQQPNARGFIGVAFRMRAPSDSFECLYVRPSNARADDQLRRNHSVQYISSPSYSWQRLRTDAPALYEAYADMEPGAWVHLRIEVAGTRARLYVNRATQPTLIVNDLKLGDGHGAIALWSHTFTDEYFANLRVK
jgi:hypothetical protein